MSGAARHEVPHDVPKEVRVGSERGGERRVSGEARAQHTHERHQPLRFEQLHTHRLWRAGEVQHQRSGHMALAHGAFGAERVVVQPSGVDLFAAQRVAALAAHRQRFDGVRQALSGGRITAQRELTRCSPHNNTPTNNITSQHGTQIIQRGREWEGQNERERGSQREGEGERRTIGFDDKRFASVSACERAETH